MKGCSEVFGIVTGAVGRCFAAMDLGHGDTFLDISSVSIKDTHQPVGGRHRLRVIPRGRHEPLSKGERQKTDTIDQAILIFLRQRILRFRLKTP